MINTASQSDRISLSLPVNAAYVSAARLTASSIANRMGFNIDEIEDIKTGVSEACTYIIRRLSPNPKSNFQIQFQMKQDQMEIHIQSNGILSVKEENDMSLIMIKALMDDFRVEQLKEEISLSLIKNHKGTLFE
jgi:serine/threonine-protein kinase RsbW